MIVILPEMPFHEVVAVILSFKDFICFKLLSFRLVQIEFP